MKIFHNIARHALKLGKFLGSLAGWFVFFFWGFQALQKFLSRPVSSSISVTNGDDGLSNLIFPAITICPRNFRIHLESILFYTEDKRCSLPYATFYEFLSQCTSSGTSSKTTTTTTTTTTGFGDLFGGYDDEIPSKDFESVMEFMNVTKVEVSEMIREFQYGDEIRISISGLSESSRKEYLNSIWIPTFDAINGPCYTFDPARQNISLLASGTKVGGEIRPQEIYIQFSVRLNL